MFTVSSHGEQASRGAVDENFIIIRIIVGFCALLIIIIIIIHSTYPCLANLCSIPNHVWTTNATGSGSGSGSRAYVGS